MLFRSTGWYKMARTLDKVSPEIAQFHGGRASVLGPWLTHLGKDSLAIITLHNVYKNYNPVIRQLLTPAIKSCNSVTCVSKTVEKSFFGSVSTNDFSNISSPPEHVTIPNGIDVKKFRSRSGSEETDKTIHSLGLNPDDSIIVNIGRLISQKDHETLLKGVKYLSEKVDKVHLLILGEGPLKGRLIETTKYLDIKDKVTFLGHKKNVSPILNAGDLFVSTSLWEGLPLSHLEAMALAKPIVSTSIPSVKELISDGTEGILVDTKSPRDLADALETLCASPEKAKQIGENARSKVKLEYNLEDVVGKYDKLYESCLN